MNLILAVALFLAVFMGFGISMQTTVGRAGQRLRHLPGRHRAARPATNPCRPSDPAAPAKTAGSEGRRQVPGVRRPARSTTGSQLSQRHPHGRRHRHHRGACGTAGRSPCTRRSPPTRSPGPTATANYVDGTVNAGFLGFSPATHIQPLGFADSVGPHGRHGPSRASTRWSALPQAHPRPVERGLRRRPAQGRLPDGRGRRGPGRRRGLRAEGARRRPGRRRW